jgi:hypothetical protein
MFMVGKRRRLKEGSGAWMSKPNGSGERDAVRLERQREREGGEGGEGVT